MAIHLIAVALTTQNPFMSNGLATMQRQGKRKNKNPGDGPSDSKCYRSATGDADDVHLLMVCEVFACCSRHHSYWKSMFNVRVWPSFFSRLTDLKMFNQLYKMHTPSLISLPELLSHDGSAILYNFTSVGQWRLESVVSEETWAGSQPHASVGML